MIKYILILNVLLFAQMFAGEMRLPGMARRVPIAHIFTPTNITAADLARYLRAFDARIHTAVNADKNTVQITPGVVKWDCIERLIKELDLSHIGISRRYDMLHHVLSDTDAYQIFTKKIDPLPDDLKQEARILLTESQSGYRYGQRLSIAEAYRISRVFLLKHEGRV